MIAGVEDAEWRAETSPANADDPFARPKDSLRIRFDDLQLIRVRIRRVEAVGLVIRVGQGTSAPCGFAKEPDRVRQIAEEASLRRGRGHLVGRVAAGNRGFGGD
jgi:hypothetical protein